MTIPTFDLDLAPPGRMSMPTFLGGGVDSRTWNGMVNTADFTGGGLLAVKYSNIGLGNTSRASLRYWSRLAAILNSGVRSIRVPLLTDFIQPEGWTATFHSSAALNASTVTLDIAGAFFLDDPLVGGEWFGVSHATKDKRAYCVSDVDSWTQTGDLTFRAVVGIRAPLREAVTSGDSVNFYRPQCLMRLAPGSQISAEIDPGWLAQPDISFVESFGTV